MRLIAVRHGQTTTNAQEILAGYRDVTLSAVGKKQAKGLGKLLQKEKIDFIYCSDLKRCKQTLKEINKYHKHIPVIFSKQIRERNFGVFEGTSQQKWYDFLAKNKYSLKFKPKRGESLKEMKKRILEFLKYLKRNHSGQKVLLVCHGGVLRVINSILTRSSLRHDMRTVRFYNTAVCEYEITKSTIKVHRFNEIKYLNK